MKDDTFPNPDGKISALKHYLHILALLQYEPDNKETWNAKSLADLLYLDEIHDTGIDESSIIKFTNNQIKELGIDIHKDRQNGKSVWSVAEDIDNKTQLEIARIYADFVIKDRSRDIALQKFIQAMPDRALWTLARVYFAVVEKRLIQVNYTGSNGIERKEWKLCPFYFFLSEFNLYLAAYDPVEDLRFTLRAEKIKNLIILDESINKQPVVSPVTKLYRNSLSAYLSPEGPVKMKIRYNKYAASNIKDLISPLESVAIAQLNENQYEAEFLIDDLLYLCKQLILYGKNVEILSPPEARQTMLKMLKESLDVYEGGK